MSASEDRVLEGISHKRGLSDEQSEFHKKPRATPLSVFDLCDATARITKKLLALGAENNWEDVKHSQGRSVEAGKYRDNWLYLSRTDHGKLADPAASEKPDWFEQFKEGIPQTFFYYPPKIEWKQHQNFIERNAAAAVLSLSGSCDQHAYVLATLLRAILPIGTVINICGLKMGGKPFPHTFVVVGSLPEQSSIPLTRLPTNDLLAVDAWPTVGGVVALKSFFVCDGALSDGVLVVDKSYIADGKDHLIGRVSKQKILLDIINADEPDIEIKRGTGLASMLHHDLKDQATYTKQIKRDRYLSESPSDYNGMFGAQTISDKYIASTKAAEAFFYISQNYPHSQFQRCLEYVNEKMKQLVAEDLNLTGDITQRLNTGF